MSRNGAGTYTWPAGSFNPAVSGASATPGDWNTGRTDLETAVSASIANDGQTTITANLPMATFKHTGVGNASARTDYAAAGQITDGVITYAIDTGAADAYAIAPTVVVDAYRVGQSFQFKVINANLTATPTLAVSSLATPGVIKWPNGTALVAGDLPASALVEVMVASIGPAVFHLQTVAVPSVRNVLTTRGDLIRAGASGVAQRVALGTTAYALLSDGTDAVWGQVSLTAGVTGILPGANGGTGFAATAAITNSLSGDVALDNTGLYRTGPTVAQGSTGTWFASGTVVYKNASDAGTLSVKLWDGTTVIASAFCNTAGLSLTQGVPISLSGYLASPAGNIRISVNDARGTSGFIAFNSSGNSKDSTLSVYRIA